MSVIRGSTLVEGPYKEQYSPSKGGIVSRNWTTNYTNGVTLCNSLANDGYEYTFTQLQQGGLWRVEATIGNDIPVYTWEFDAEQVERDLLNATSVSSVNLLSIANKQVLQYAMRNIEDLRGELPTPTGNNLTQAEIDAFYQIWRHIVAGQRAVIEYVPIVRRSYIVSSQYQITDSKLYVNQPHSKDTLINVEGLPAQYWDIVEDSGPDTIGIAGETINVNWGWLKKYPKIELVSNNRTQISQEWVYNAYSVMSYGDLI